MMDDTPTEVPAHEQTEAALLGALLSNNRLLDGVADIVGPDDFGIDLHADIFRAIQKLVADGRRADPVTLQPVFGDRLIRHGLSVNQYVGRLYAGVISLRADDVMDYARAVAEFSARRRLLDLAHMILATESDVPVDDLRTAVEARLTEIVRPDAHEHLEVGFDEALTRAVEMMADAYQRDGHLAGIATGLVDLDGKMGGLQKSDLIVLAGRPSMGKTALATNIAYNVARAGVHVHFFSQEMSAEQLALRVLAERSEIPSHRLRRGAIDEDQFRKAMDVVHAIKDTRMTIDETGGLSVTRLASKARRVARTKGTGLIVVDYLQLMSGAPGKRGQNRTQEITEITTGLKALAKELAVPIIALSQLSREVEKRTDKRPQLSDLRESGSIEQDADVVMFVFREEYYVEREKPDENTSEFLDWQTRMTRCAGKAEVILGKQRHGPLGTVVMNFNGEFTRFADQARGADHARA